VLRNNEEGKAYLYEEFEKMNLDYVPTETNFISVNLKRDAKEVFGSLLRSGVIIRPGHLWNLPSFARVTIGTMDENRQLIRALRSALSIA
jgi:histidinol-phosphate aminotransferase